MYRSEVHASLESLLLIHTYTELYDTVITNNITGLCDNEAYVNKLNEIITNPKYLKYLYKTTEHEAYKLLSTLIPINYTLRHINSYQDDNCSYNELPLPTKLNIQADKIATNYARKLINNVANKYIPHNIDHKIRDSSHSSITKDFVAQKKTEQCQQCLESIGRIIPLASASFPTQKIFTRRFIHHYLPTVKVQFSNRSRCPHCDIMFTNTTTLTITF